MKIDLQKTPKTKMKRKRNKKLIVSLSVAGGILVILGVYFAVSGMTTIKYARAAQTSLSEAQAHLVEQDFTAAAASLEETTNALIDTRASLNRFTAIGFIPYINRQLVAARHIIDGGIISVQALIDVTAMGDSIITPITGSETVSLASLSPDEKSDLINKISEAEPELINIQAQLADAREEFVAVPTKGLVGPLAKIQKEINDKLPELDQVIDSALPLVRILPDLVGHPTPNTYLFLLENNSELRPTGGFIGTYGVIKVHEAEITEFETDNVYNLDSQSDLNVTPPLPLQRYIQADKWFLRDANWSPDFPTAAEQSIRFYEQEGGPVRGFDGVIAITPTVIARLLGITGPIETDGVTFTSENFETELYYQVSKGYLRQGVEFSDRKDIIGNLGTILITKLLSLPQEHWPLLWQNLITNLDEKHFLLYSRNDEAQAMLVDQGWGGAVTQTAGDYFHVVDANMASLKSDPAVKRTIRYRLNADSETPTATLSMEYNHVGGFDERTTRYRTYVRFYVPEGSELVSTDGNDTDVETDTEEGKTVFGTFMSIEPGTTETISLTYTLPGRIAQSLENGQYTLLAQKQAGTVDHKLEIELSFDRDVSEVTPHSAVVDKKGLKYQTTFLTDQILDVQL